MSGKMVPGEAAINPLDQHRYRDHAGKDPQVIARSGIFLNVHAQPSPG